VIPHIRAHIISKPLIKLCTNHEYGFSNDVISECDFEQWYNGGGPGRHPCHHGPITWSLPTHDVSKVELVFRGTGVGYDQNNPDVSCIDRTQEEWIRENGFAGFAMVGDLKIKYKQPW